MVTFLLESGKLIMTLIIPKKKRKRKKKCSLRYVGQDAKKVYDNNNNNNWSSQLEEPLECLQGSINWTKFPRRLLSDHGSMESLRSYS